eukprot:s330_g21.t2
MAYGGVPATRHRPPAQGVWRSAWWHQMQPLARIRKEGALEETLARVTRHHVAVDPSPDIKDQLVLLHADPAVLLIPGLWSQQACDKLILAALCSGAMRQSSCSGYGIETGEAQAARTSGSVVMKPDLAGRFGAEGLVRKLVRDLTGVLGVGGAPGESAEYPQVVRYERGQRFDLHEDAFAWEQVKQDNYQRHATLLVYLNDVDRGGATRFPDLNLEIQPRCGQGLLFFPAFRDGHPDERTMHSAEPALDEKWVAQVWLGQRIQYHRLPGESGRVNGDRTLDTQVFLPQHSADMKPEPI